MKESYNLKELKKREGKVKSSAAADRIMISLKIDANDLANLKTEAERLGMPYQTLINSVLHRFVSAELIDKRELTIIKAAR